MGIPWALAGCIEPDLAGLHPGFFSAHLESRGDESERNSGNAAGFGPGTSNSLPGNRVQLVPLHQFSWWNKYQFDPLWSASVGLIYFSAFFVLLFQIKGLIGPEGILPASHYLAEVKASFGVPGRYWFAPSLYWISAGSRAMMTVTWIGLVASAAAFFNVWPRLTLFICWICFLSFVTTAQVFSGYQSDGMLLEAGFIALFCAPRGLLPGWGAATPPPRASIFLLQWEWFRIYFESGIVKLLSGDPQWRHLTAMDEYYQNGPLPTWIGWYVQHFPHWFQVATAGATLVMELGRTIIGSKK